MVGKYLFIGITLPFMVLFSCSNKNVENNEINITVKVIDSYSKKPRVGDFVILKQIKWGFPMRKSSKINEKKTDTLGEVRFKIDKAKAYIIWAKGENNAFGSTEFKEGELKDNQQIIIEVVPPDKKQFKIE